MYKLHRSAVLAASECSVFLPQFLIKENAFGVSPEHEWKLLIWQVLGKQHCLLLYVWTAFEPLEKYFMRALYLQNCSKSRIRYFQCSEWNWTNYWRLRRVYASMCRLADMEKRRIDSYVQTFGGLLLVVGGYDYNEGKRCSAFGCSCSE